MAKIDKKYHNLLETILKEGFSYEDPNRKKVKRIQIPKYTFEHDFKDGFPAITTKKLFWKGVVGELIWFLRGDTNIKYLVDNGIPIWNKDAYNYYLKQTNQKNTQETKEEFDKGIHELNHIAGNLGRVYGYQLRNFGGEFDQLEWIIDTMRNNPRATKKTVTFINPNDRDYQALTPCHTGFKILVEPIKLGSRMKLCDSKKLEKYIIENIENSKSAKEVREEYIDNNNTPKYQFTLQWEQDSVDTFLGLPFNIASYALLAHILGKLTNMIPKGIVGDLSNVHIYEPHLGAVKEQLNNDVNEYDNCRINTEGFLSRVQNYNYLDNNVELDEIINDFKISDFNLENYQSYPYIKAKMLPYNK